MELKLRKFNLYQVLNDDKKVVGYISERNGYWLWNVNGQRGDLKAARGKADSQDDAAKKVIEHGT